MGAIKPKLGYERWTRSQAHIVVAVLGSAPRPGLYELPVGSTVADAVVRAGACVDAGSEGFAAVTLRRPHGWDGETPRKVTCWRGRRFRKGAWRSVPLLHEDGIVLQYLDSELRRLEVLPMGLSVD